MAAPRRAAHGKTGLPDHSRKHGASGGVNVRVCVCVRLLLPVVASVVAQVSALVVFHSPTPSRVCAPLRCCSRKTR